MRRVGLFVGAGEGVAPLGHADLIAVGYTSARRCEEFLHVFAPGPHGGPNPVGHFCGVDRGKRFAAGHPGGEVQAGERGGTQLDVEVHAFSPVALTQDALNALARSCVVEVARHVHEHGHEAFVFVTADEDAGFALLLQVDHRQDDLFDVFDGRLEDFVARVAFEHRQEFVTGVRFAGHSGAFDDRADLAADDRDVED